MVIWIIGLSGAGKTTVARRVHELWANAAPNTVLVDGDEVREIMRENIQPDSHELSGRRRNAERIFRLCHWLDKQNINVVCSILSIFPDLREENRQEFSKYFEVFIDVPMDELVRRDIKDIYAPALRGERTHVVGVDIPFPRPDSADLIIDNSEPDIDIDKVARQILKANGIEL